MAAALKHELILCVQQLEHSCSWNNYHAASSAITAAIEAELMQACEREREGQRELVRVCMAFRCSSFTAAVHQRYTVGNGQDAEQS